MRFVSGASGSAEISYQPNVRLVERADAIRKIMAVVGASAQAFGQKTEPLSHTIFEKQFIRIDPPSVKLCKLES
jgi:hypothetical protein